MILKDKSKSHYFSYRCARFTSSFGYKTQIYWPCGPAASPFSLAGGSLLSNQGRVPAGILIVRTYPHTIRVPLRGTLILTRIDALVLGARPLLPRQFTLEIIKLRISKACGFASAKLYATHSYLPPL